MSDLVGATLVAVCDPALHAEPCAHRLVPAMDVREIFELLALLVVVHEPGIDRHVGDRVIARDPLAFGERAFQYTVETVHLVGVALDAIGHLLRGELAEVVGLARHRAESADLPEEPLQHPVAALRFLRQEAAGALGQIHEDGTRFKDRQRRAARVVDDHRRDLVVRADLEEVGLELRAAGDVHIGDAVLEAAFLEHDRGLEPVRTRVEVQRDHGPSVA